MKILALDFDGVLFDGSREIFITAINTYQRVTNSTPFCNEHLSFDAYEKHPSLEDLYEKFEEMYCYGKGGHYQFAMVKAVAEKIEITCQEDLDKLAKECKGKTTDNYKIKYYEERDKLRNMDFEKWMDLHKAFTQITDNLSKLPSHIVPCIATAKDKKSVELLLKHFNIAPMKVLDKKYGYNKTVHMEHLKQEFGVSSQDICFIDDRLPVLLKTLDTGVHCFLATWGSNNVNQQKQAIEQGISVLKQEEFYDKICKILEK